MLLGDIVTSLDDMEIELIRAYRMMPEETKVRQHYIFCLIGNSFGVGLGDFLYFGTGHNKKQKLP